MSKIVVIGANHAGTAAINTILDHHPGNEVVVFDANDNISFLGCGMALWIGRQIESAEGLFYATKEALEEKGARIYMETPVERIDFAEKTVYAKGKNGQAHSETYDKLILATGSLPIVPDVPGVELKNVQQVKLYQNAAEVIEKLDDPGIKNVVVVGAGYIGVELAEAFRRREKQVTMLDMAGTCLSGYFDEPFSTTMVGRLAKHGVLMGFQQKVLRFEGENGRVTRVITDKSEYQADMVVLAVGFRPNTALGASHLPLFRNGAYLVDRRGRTEDADVFAIGDCATVYDNVVHGTNYIALATNAVRAGILAAHNACGTVIESPGVQGSNGISIWGLNMVSTGATLTRALALGFDAVAADYEDLQKPAFIKENCTARIRIVYDKKTRVVLGAQMASDYDLSMGIHMFSLAIQESVTIDKLKLLDIFFLPHFNQPYNYITMAAMGAR